MEAVPRLAVFDELGECPGSSECPGNLLVQLLPVGDDDERPVATKTPQHLFGKHHHRKTLATALRMPEDAKSALVLSDLLYRFDGTVHPEHLMILGDDLAQPAPHIIEQKEALN